MEPKENETLKSCEGCAVKDCPTRGLLDVQTGCSFTPKRMVFGSFAMFLLPLLGAFFAASRLENGSVTQLAGAVGGFLVGMAIAMLGVRIFHGN